MSRRGERGQATVEFALIIPLVLVVGMALVQVALVAYAQLSVIHIARETARAVAADPTADIGHLMHETGPLGSEGLIIDINFEISPVLDRDFVVVTVSYETPSVSRLFDPFATHFEVSAQVSMLTES